MKNCKIFIEMIKKEQFIEAHEILEEDWKRLKITDPIKSNILKGFINGATAFALYKKGNIKGYERVWKTFLKYEKLIDKNLNDFLLFEEMQKILHDINNKIKANYKRDFTAS